MTDWPANGGAFCCRCDYERWVSNEGHSRDAAQPELPSRVEMRVIQQPHSETVLPV